MMFHHPYIILTNKAFLQLFMLPTSKLKIITKLRLDLDPLILKYFTMWKFKVIKFVLKHSKHIHPSINPNHQKKKQDNVHIYIFERYMNTDENWASWNLLFVPDFQPASTASELKFCSPSKPVFNFPSLLVSRLQRIRTKHVYVVPGILPIISNINMSDG